MLGPSVLYISAPVVLVYALRCWLRAPKRIIGIAVLLLALAEAAVTLRCLFRVFFM